jgi:hypothetical protein
MTDDLLLISFLISGSLVFHSVSFRPLFCDVRLHHLIYLSTSFLRFVNIPLSSPAYSFLFLGGNFDIFCFAILYENLAFEKRLWNGIWDSTTWSFTKGLYFLFCFFCCSFCVIS